METTFYIGLGIGIVGALFVIYVALPRVSGGKFLPGGGRSGDKKQRL